MGVQLSRGVEFWGRAGVDETGEVSMLPLDREVGNGPADQAEEAAWPSAPYTSLYLLIHLLIHPMYAAPPTSTGPAVCGVSHERDVG